MHTKRHTQTNKHACGSCSELEFLEEHLLSGHSYLVLPQDSPRSAAPLVFSPAERHTRRPALLGNLIRACTRSSLQCAHAVEPIPWRLVEFRCWGLCSAGAKADRPDGILGDKTSSPSCSPANFCSQRSLACFIGDKGVSGESSMTSPVLPHGAVDTSCLHATQIVDIVQCKIQ